MQYAARAKASNVLPPAMQRPLIIDLRKIMAHPY